MHRSVLWLFSLLGLTVELSSACGGDGEPSDVAGSAGPAPTSTSAVPPLPEDGGPAPGPTSLRFVAVGDTGTGTSAQTKIGNTISATCNR